jgi:hypothetical protein
LIRAPTRSEPGSIHTRAATGASAHATLPLPHLLQLLELILGENRLHPLPLLPHRVLASLTALFHERHQLAAPYLSSLELRPHLLQLGHLFRPTPDGFLTESIEALDLTIRQLEALPRPHDRLHVLSRDFRSAHDHEHTQSDDAAGDLPHR